MCQLGLAIVIIFLFFLSGSVQFSCVLLFATSWTAACQASLSITNSWSLLKLMSIEWVMPFNHLILYHPFLFLPSIFISIRVFFNETVICIRWPKDWSFSFSTSIQMNNQEWFPLGLTGLIYLQSKGLSSLLQNQVQKHQFFITSYLYGPALTSIHDYWKSHNFD